jgi:hypothetical protein
MIKKRNRQQMRTGKNYCKEEGGRRRGAQEGSIIHHHRKNNTKTDKPGCARPPDCSSIYGQRSVTLWDNN